MIKKNIWNEQLYKSCGQYFLVKKILCSKNTKYQNLLIFENSFFGKIMALDNIVQTTEKDEFIYHEMMTHVPLFSHPFPKKVLIIGGGDGGILREISYHKYIKKISMVEIDSDVIKYAQKYLPNHGSFSWKDKRLKLIIKNGIDFVNECSKKFDVVIVDNSDPIGPSKNLFSSNFYKKCKNLLNKDGIFVIQNGVNFLQKNNCIQNYKKLCLYFKYVKIYQATVPSYYGGNMTFSIASKNTNFEKINLNSIKNRFFKTYLNCKYYNPMLHISSFVLPKYLFDKCQVNNIRYGEIN